MSDKSVVELGDRVEDVVTGLKGIAMSKSEWINKCVRFGIQPESHKDGKPADLAFIDVEQLKVLKKGVIKVDKAVPVEIRTNGPRADAGRRPDDKR